MTKRIVLCADDYGQAPAISKGIVSLIKYGRLSATSCMVNAPYWPEHSKWLIPLTSFAGLGLHFNLTHGKPLSKAFINLYGENFPTLSSLLVKAYTGRLDKNVIAAEFEAQIDSFEEGVGSLPDFVDGHQHVHQFPVIRDAFVDVYKRRMENEAPYVRWVNEKIYPSDFLNNFKKIIIRVAGSKSFKALLEENHIPHNETFAGIYPFGQAVKHYREWFLKFINASQDGAIVMCHPSLAASDSEDPIAAARFAEYQYLFGTHFLQDCYLNGVTLLARKAAVEDLDMA